jgi:glyoxylase-like metal-dependent hydrolase (beta-lactamase superfamily II)
MLKSGLQVIVLLVLVTGLLAGVAVRAQAPGWPTPFGPTPGTMTKIDDGLYVYSHSGTNALVMLTAEGVIVGDPVNPWAARDMRAKIRELTDQPVRYLVYSHAHWDHALGGQPFKADGATFVAHENVKRAFERDPHPDAVMPDVTFTDRYVLRLGGRTLELFHLGINHSDGMIFMRPDNGPYLFAVDMVTPGKVPLSYFYDYDISGYVRTMLQLESWPGITTILPGHGPPLAPMAALTERRRYVEALLAAVKAEMQKGTPLPQIIETVELPAFAHMEGYDRFRRLNVERIVAYWVMGK